MDARRAISGLAAAAALAAILLSTAGCDALGVAQRETSVVIEGIVVPGETYRVEPLDELPAEWSGPGLPAKVTISNGYGETVEADCDARGMFRTAPILLSGQNDDRLVVSCPGSRGLCLSALGAPRVEARPGEEPVVRWRITLPPLESAHPRPERGAAG